MVNIAHYAFNHFVPPAEELWQAGGADIISTEVDPGRFVDIPYFDPIYTKEPKLLKEERIITRSGRLLGTRALHQFEIDGIDLIAKANVPNDDDRGDHDFTTLRSLAWFTTPDGGYPQDCDDKLLAATGMPSISIGPPHSGKLLASPLEVFRIPQTIKKARRLSLAYSAQVEQKIAGYLTESYDFPKEQMKIGDSRGDNMSFGHFPYTHEHRARIIGMDVKGHVAPHKIELGDLPGLAGWILATNLGGLAAAACLAERGELGTLKGSTSLNPNFIAGALSGTLRSLSSGETGKMISWVPRDTYGIDVLYGLDWPGGVEEFETLMQGLPNIRRKVVRGGTHGALLHPIGHVGQTTRIERAANEYHDKRGNVHAMNWNHIHGVKELMVIDEEAA